MQAYLPTVFVAAGWGMLLAGTHELAVFRSLAFVGGPIVLLAGIHARTWGYLHDPQRFATLPLPLAPDVHWREGHAPHVRGGLVVASVVCLAWLLAAFAPAFTAAQGPDTAPRLWVVAELLWLLAIASGIERIGAGAAAAAGRRVESGQLAELQTSISGGWTAPEAAVHLWWPALAIGLSAALALPGQLALEWWVDGRATTPAVAFTVLPGFVALIGARVGASFHAKGVFEAVPWLHEASRTLQGPPVPEIAPAWLRSVRDPALRIVLLQAWRVTPTPGLRATALLAVPALIWLWSLGPQPAAWALWLAACVAWIFPFGSLAKLAPERKRLFAALPLPSDVRRHGGRHPWGLGWLLLAAPPTASLLACVVLWSLR
jgi:hypothetical protein